MAVIVTKQEDINAYFDSDALSQSKLKLLLKGFDHFLSNQKEEKDLYYEEKDYFVVGSGVDTKLTGESGIYDTLFYTSKLEKKPSDAEMSMINYVFDELVENNVEVDLTLAEYPNMLKNSIVEHDWYKGKPGEKRIAGLIERCSPYFEDLKASFGKQIVSKEQQALIDDIVMSLSTNFSTAKYFDREEQSRLENMDFYYQLPIYFTYEGIECKALLDLLVVYKDDQGRIISLHPIDLKTMFGNTLSFINKVKQHRYDIQASWYTNALKEWLKTQETVKEGVDIAPFKFIVESTSKPGTPLVYRLDSSLMNMGQVGRPELKTVAAPSSTKEGHATILYDIKHKEIKGIDTLIKEYQYYEETGWQQDKVIADNPVLLELSWDGIK